MDAGFIGIGNMAAAVIQGMRKNGGFCAIKIFLYNRRPEKALKFLNENSMLCENEAEVVKRSDYIFIAVKPADIETALKNITDNCEYNAYKNKVFISMAAAVTTGYISDMLGGAKVIRTMPNIPFTTGMGATAICAGEGVECGELNFVKSIFESGGRCSVLDETLMNKIIAVSGSSPAYVLLFIKLISEWAQNNGINSGEAQKMAAQAFMGAAKLLLESDKNVDELINAVCSPGGTTVEAIKIFNERGIKEIFNEAMHACTSKADQMQR